MLDFPPQRFAKAYRELPAKISSLGGRHAPYLWEGYHIDHDTNSFLPPCAEIDTYFNSGTYLHDVEADGAPMHVIPGSHRQIIELLPLLLEQGLYKPPTTITDLREVLEFATPVPTTAKAGMLLLCLKAVIRVAAGQKLKHLPLLHEA